MPYSKSFISRRGLANYYANRSVLIVSTVLLVLLTQQQQQKNDDSFGVFALALDCECTGEEHTVIGTTERVGYKCLQWGEKQSECATVAPAVTQECCKPWCWVDKTHCPTARYNEEAKKYYSYDACNYGPQAMCASDLCGEEQAYKDTRGNVYCASDYANAWYRYRMSTWVFFIPIFCLCSAISRRRRYAYYMQQQQQQGYPSGAPPGGYYASGHRSAFPLWRGQNFGRQQQQPQVFVIQNRNSAMPMSMQQNQRNVGAPAPTMAPLHREQAAYYATPSNYYGNDASSSSQQTQSTTTTTPTAYPTI